MLALCAAAAGAQTPAPGGRADSQANAAEVYRLAIAEMHAALGNADGDGPELPWVFDNPEADYVTDEWVAVVDKSATARTLFAQATDMKTCCFDAKSPSKLGELRDRLLDLTSLKTLVMASAWQQVAKQPAGALATCRHLFAHAGHMGQDPSLFGTIMRYSVEYEAVTICTRTLARHRGAAIGREALERTLTILDRHRDGQPSAKEIAARCLADSRAQLELAATEAKPQRDAMQSATERALELLEELLAPMRAAGPIDVAALKKQTDARLATWKAKTRDANLQEVLENGVGEVLATALATLVAPDPVRLLEMQQKSAAQLTALRAQLRARLDELQAPKKPDDQSGR